MTDLGHWCCSVRRKLVIGIIGERPDQPDPDPREILRLTTGIMASGHPRLRIRYCCFCGAEIDPSAPTTDTKVELHEEEEPDDAF